MKLTELCSDMLYQQSGYNPIKLDDYNQPIIPVLCEQIKPDDKTPQSLSMRQIFQLDTQVKAQDAFFNEKNCARGDNY